MEVVNHIKPLPKKILKLLALIALVVFILFPIFWIFLMSLKKAVDLATYPPTVIFKPIIDNYLAVFGLPVNSSNLSTTVSVEFLDGYKNSIIICTGALLIASILSIPAAYALARYEFRWKERLAFLFLGFRFVPDMAVLIPIYLISIRLHFYDTKLGLMIAFQSFMLPFMIWTMRGYIKEVPIELEEAAAIDGCSAIGVFRHITLPLAAPGIAATMALTFIFTWNNFTYGLILSQMNAQPVTVKMLGFITYSVTLWGQLAAASILIIIPEIIIGFFIQKYLVRGLTYGIH